MRWLLIATRNRQGARYFNDPSPSPTCRQFTTQFLVQTAEGISSKHIDGVASEQEEWMQMIWPEIMRFAKEKGSMVLFGDEVSFAQWGSLSSLPSFRGQCIIFSSYFPPPLPPR